MYSVLTAGFQFRRPNHFITLPPQHIEIYLLTPGFQLRLPNRLATYAASLSTLIYMYLQEDLKSEALTAGPRVHCLPQHIDIHVLTPGFQVRLPIQLTTLPYSAHLYTCTYHKISSPTP